MTREIRFTLIGLGNIGRNLLDVLLQRQDAIAPSATRPPMRLCGQCSSSRSGTARW